MRNIDRFLSRRIKYWQMDSCRHQSRQKCPRVYSSTIVISSDATKSDWVLGYFNNKQGPFLQLSRISIWRVPRHIKEALIDTNELDGRHKEKEHRRCQYDTHRSTDLTALKSPIRDESLFKAKLSNTGRHHEQIERHKVTRWHQRGVRGLQLDSSINFTTFRTSLRCSKPSNSHHY